MESRGDVENRSQASDHNDPDEWILSREKFVPRAFRGAIGIISALLVALAVGWRQHPPRTPPARARSLDRTRSPRNGPRRRSSASSTSSAASMGSSRCASTARSPGPPASTARRCRRRTASRTSARASPISIARAKQAGFLPCNCYWGVGENLAWGPGSRGNARNIVGAWMGSPQHRAAILDRKFRDVGVGFRRGSPYRRHSAAGTYTLDFGYKR